MMGKLYSHKVSVAEIKKMPFKEMEYWHKWNLAMDEGLKRAMKKGK